MTTLTATGVRLGTALITLTGQEPPWNPAAAHDPKAVPPAQRVSRDLMRRVANSYFDALEGDSGKIGAFANDCATRTAIARCRTWSRWKPSRCAAA